MKSPNDNIALGVIVIIATVCTMAFTDAVIKYFSASFPLWQIFVVRSLIAITILVTLMLLTKTTVHIFPQAMRWVAARSFLLAFMYIAIYAAVPKLPLAIIAAALYTGPLFVALFSALWVKKPVGARGWLAIALGFFGVLVMLRPNTSAFSFYALIPIIAGLFYALAAIITRAKCADEKPQVLAMMLNLSIFAVGLIATIVIAAIQPIINAEIYPFLLGGWVTMGASEWKIMSLLSVLIVLIGLGLAKAYQSAPPTIIATFDYAYLLFAALFGFLFFAEIPDTPTIIGMLMIATAGLVVVSRKAKTQRN